jgi:hypothetical protein
MATPLIDETPLSAKSLHAKLMSPRAIERVRALHALERLVPSVSDPRAAHELDAFVARGIPYFAPHEADYCQWVEKAVRHWENLQRPGQTHDSSAAQAQSHPEPTLASALG